MRSIVVAVCLGLVACGAPGPGTGDESGTDLVIELRAAVSESALPLMRLLGPEAEGADPGVRLTLLPPVHSGGALAATVTGDADLGVMTRMPTPEEERHGLRYMHVARDGLVFVAHKDVPVDDLTSDQVRGIYSGAITSWKELGGEDREIVVLDRPEHTSPKLVLRDQLFGEDLAITPEAVVLERPAMMNVSLNTLEGSIGYTSVGEIVSEDLDFRVMSLDGIQPTPQNVENGVYTLSRSIGFVIRPRPSREVMRFFEFVYGDDGFRVMRGNGYSPIVMNLVIATIPERDTIRQDERYRPLVDFLSTRLGGRVRIRLSHLSRYDEVVSAIAARNANAAFMGSFTYALARARMDVEPVARPEKDGLSTYRGLIFARKDSGIADWRDLRGRKFSMIRDTMAGDIFPRVFLERHGAGDPERFFGQIVWSGSHDTSVRKVLDGEADAGAAKDLVYLRLAREDPRIDNEMVILSTSEPVPENALVVASPLDIACISCHQQPDLDGGGQPSPDWSGRRVRERLREELLNLDKTAEGREVLEAIGADRFLETDDSDYENLYRMIERLGLDLSRP